MMGEVSHASYCHTCHANGFSHKGPVLSQKRHQGEGMVILTINIPRKVREMLDTLVVGEDALYPSRSEIIRVALHDFLQEEFAYRDRLAQPVEVESPPMNPNLIQFSDGQTVGLKVDEQGGMHP
jgi:Arc/MetJ-type ribon-helix-helix transcriptional regulator